MIGVVFRGAATRPDRLSPARRAVGLVLPFRYDGRLEKPFDFGGRTDAACWTAHHLPQLDR
jgi:hypothetical protein